MPEKSLLFESGGGTKEIQFSNKSIIPCVIEAENCSAEPIYASGNSFLPQGVRITAAPNNSTEQIAGKVMIAATNGRTTEIAVTVKGAAPYIDLGEAITIDCAATMREIAFSSNIPESELTYSSSADSWCKVVYLGERTLSLTISENLTANDRTATITVSAKDGKIKDELMIVQGKPSISIDGPQTVEFSAAANGTATITVVTGVSSYEVTSDKSWCKVTKSEYAEKIFVITVDENNDGKERTATVTASVDGNKEVSASVTVKQAPHTFELSSEKIAFDRQLQNTSITLTTTASGFTATSSDTSWCTLSWNGKTLTIRATGNDTQKNRTATITVKLADNQSKTIRVDQSRYMVGDYYNENNLEGVIYLLKPDFHGAIVSVDEGFNLAWSTENVAIGATDLDGMANMNIVKRIPDWQTLYPAFAWCEAKNTHGVTGWYLPARNELITISKGFDAINKTLQAKGQTPLSSWSNVFYWSSSENSWASAWTVDLSNGSDRSKNKYSQFQVRSVAAF